MADLTSKLAAQFGMGDRRRSRVDWAAIGAGLGVELPDDYRNLVETFPTGAFNEEYITLRHPGLFRRGKEFAADSQLFCERLAGRRAVRNPDSELDLFPAPGGLLPWGFVGADWVFCWRVVGEPQGWSSVAVRPTFTLSHELRGSMTEALDGVINGHSGISAFSYLAEQRDFVPRVGFQ